MRTILVNGVKVFEDEQNRYCLQNLKTALGRKTYKTPGLWLNRASTNHLIITVERSTRRWGESIVINPAHDSDAVFAHPELAMNFSGWLSADLRFGFASALFNSKRTSPAQQLIQVIQQEQRIQRGQQCTT